MPGRGTSPLEPGPPARCSRSRARRDRGLERRAQGCREDVGDTLGGLPVPERDRTRCVCPPGRVDLRDRGRIVADQRVRPLEDRDRALRVGAQRVAGTPSAAASSCRPPESVTMIAAPLSSERKSRYPSGSRQATPAASRRARPSPAASFARVRGWMGRGPWCAPPGRPARRRRLAGCSPRRRSTGGGA